MTNRCMCGKSNSGSAFGGAISGATIGRHLCDQQYVVGGLGSDRILFPRMRGTRIKINELNEESGQNPEI